MHCGPPIQNFGWAVAHAAHASSAPHVLVRGVIALHTLPVASNQALWIRRSVSQNSSQPFSSYSELFVESRQFQPTPTAFGVFIGVIPFEFCPDLRHQKTSLPGLLCGVACVILHLAVSEEHQLVTDADLSTMKKNFRTKNFQYFRTFFRTHNAMKI